MDWEAIIHWKEGDLSKRIARRRGGGPGGGV